MKSDKLSVFEFVNSVFDRTCHDPCPREPLWAIKFWQVTVLAEIVLGSRNPLSHLLASSSKTFRMVAPMRTFAPLNVTVESHGMVSGRVGPTKTFKSGTNPPFRASPNLFSLWAYLWRLRFPLENGCINCEQIIEWHRTSLRWRYVYLWQMDPL